MNKIIALIAVPLIFMVSSTALADGGDTAGAVIISFMAAKGVEGTALQGIEDIELPEWKEKRSNLTAELGEMCSLRYEVRLIGNLAANAAWISLKNIGEKQLSFNPIETEFKFSDGVARRPDIFRFNEVFFEPGRLYNLILPFPDKENFAKQTHLTMSMPVQVDRKPCNLVIRMQRNPEIPDTIKTSVPLNILESEIGMGSFVLGGALAELTDKTGSLAAFHFRVFGRPNHGMYFSAKFFDERKINPQPAADIGLDTSWDVGRSFWSIGYNYRHIIDRDHNFIWGLGLGSFLIQARKESDHFKIADVSVIETAIGYRHIYLRKKAGLWKGNYYWGVDLAALGVTNDKESRGGIKTEGHALGATVSLGIGAP